LNDTPAFNDELGDIRPPDERGGVVMVETLKRGLQAVVLVLCVGGVMGGAGAAERWGLYLHAPLPGNDTVAKVSANLAQTANAMGLGVLVTTPITTGNPKWEAQVLVLDDPAYRQAVLKQGGGKGGFAATLRLAVCRDGANRFISILNPMALASVFVGAGGGRQISPIINASQEALDRLLALVKQGAGAVLGGEGEEGAGLGHAEPVRLENVWPQYRSFFGTTMPEALVERGSIPGNLNQAVEQISRTIGQHDKGIPLYQLVDEQAGVAVIGISWAWIEKTAFEIIKKIDHAPAFPLEFVLVREGNRVKVETLAEMWRMDVYFSDASKWAFMTHIAIPGELDDQKAALVAATP